MLPAEMERTDGGREDSPFCAVRKMLSISRLRPLLEKVPGCIANGRYLTCCQALLEAQTGVAWNAGRVRLRCGDGFLHFLQRS